MKKKDPKKLRIEAQKLLETAERIENEKLIRIGKLVTKYAENDFSDFDVEKFKNEVAKF